MRPTRSVLRIASVVMYALGILGGLYTTAALSDSKGSEEVVDRFIFAIGAVSVLTLTAGVVGSVCNSIRLIVVVNVPVLTSISVLMYLIWKLGMVLNGNEFVDGVAEKTMENWLGFEENEIVPSSLDLHVLHGGQLILAFLLVTALQFFAALRLLLTI